MIEVFDGAGEDQHADDDHEDVEDQPQQLRARRGASRGRPAGCSTYSGRTASGMIMPANSVITPVQNTA